MTTTHLALVPRDGLFAKDGRGWHTSASGRGHGLDWPWPSTVLGALRSAWGRGKEARTGTTFTSSDWRTHTVPIHLGRTLVLRRKPGDVWRSGDVVWPVSADALWLEDQAMVHPLVPVPITTPTLGRNDDPARETLMWPLSEGGKPLTSPRWWNNEDFSAWLTGRPVAARNALSTTRRVQAHVGIRPEELTSDDGVLFSHDVLETLEPSGEWAIGVEVAFPDGHVAEIARLGSDSRIARVELLPAVLFDPPAHVLAAFRGSSQGLRVIAITPLCFEKGWLPDGLVERNGRYVGRLGSLGHEVVLRSAFVSRPVHVSGWDMAANQGKGAPKPTSRMVSSGAVYFFERADGKPFNEIDAKALWLGTLGSRTDEGFGRVVPAVWKPTRNAP